RFGVVLLPSSAACPFTTLFRSRADEVGHLPLLQRHREVAGDGDAPRPVRAGVGDGDVAELDERTFQLRIADFGSGISGRSYSRADRKSTRLNSSHVKIPYAVFC